MFLSVFGHYVDAANIQNIFSVNKTFAIYFGRMSIFVDICVETNIFLHNLECFSYLWGVN